MTTNHKNALGVIVTLAVVSAAGSVWTLARAEGPLVAQQTAQRQPGAEGVGAATGELLGQPELKPLPALAAPVVEYYRAGNLQRAYGTAFLTGRDMNDPEMAKLAESEGELAREADELLEQYAAREDAAEQKKIKADLRQTLTKQFDVQRERRELELARIEERVRKLREQNKKRNDAKETIIDRRLEQLVNDAEGLGWTPGAASGVRDGQEIRVYRNAPLRAHTARP